MRVISCSLLPLNEPQQPPTDHNADTNVSAPAPVPSPINKSLFWMIYGRCRFPSIKHWPYSHKMPEFKGAWHRGKPTVVPTHCANRMQGRKTYFNTKIPYA
jgi:hypothetical protein